MNPNIFREAWWEKTVSLSLYKHFNGWCPDYAWHTCVPRARHCADWTGRQMIWSWRSDVERCMPGWSRAEVASDVASELARSTATAAGQPASLLLCGALSLFRRVRCCSGKGACGRCLGRPHGWPIFIAGGMYCGW